MYTALREMILDDPESLASNLNWLVWTWLTLHVEIPTAYDGIIKIVTLLVRQRLPVDFLHMDRDRDNTIPYDSKDIAMANIVLDLMRTNMKEQDIEQLQLDNLASAVLTRGFINADCALNREDRSDTQKYTKELYSAFMMFGIAFDKNYIPPPVDGPTRFVLSPIPPVNTDAFNRRYDYLRQNDPSLYHVPRGVLEMWINSGV